MHFLFTMSDFISIFEISWCIFIYVYYCKDIQWSLKRFSEYDVQERISWMQEFNAQLSVQATISFTNA